MKHLFTLLIFLISFPLTAVTYSNQLEPHIIYARQARIGSVNSEEALEKNFETLPLYGNGSSLKMAIVNMLQTELGLGLDKEELLPLAGSEIAGRSDDPVFFLLKKKNLMMVIKAFVDPKSPSSKFLPELSGLDFLQNHSELGISSPRPLAVGKTWVGDKWYGLLAESPALGKRIDSYILDIPEKDDGKTRRKKVQLADKILSMAAVSFANQNNTKGLKRSLSSKEAVKIQDRVKKLEQQQSILQIDLQPLKEKVMQLTEIAQNLKFLLGYSHNSAHSANVFYEEKEDRIWYIDVAKFHKSFNVNEEPLSFSAYDIIRLTENVRKISLGHLSPEEANSIISHALHIYLHTSEDPEAKILIELFQLDSFMKRLITIAKNLNSPDEKTRRQAKELQEVIKRELSVSLATDSVLAK